MMIVNIKTVKRKTKQSKKQGAIVVQVQATLVLL